MTGIVHQMGQEQGVRSLFLGAMVLLVLLGAGCDREPSGDARAGARSRTSAPTSAPSPAGTGGAANPIGTEPQTSAPSVSEEEIERLRSLGYLDTTGLPRSGAGRGVQVLDAALVSPGYTLVVFAGACSCELLSPSGEVVRSWKDQPCHRWEHAELLPSGDLVVVGARLDEDAVEDPIESGRYLLRLSWDGAIVWRRDINVHHDLSVAPDGTLLTLVLKRRRIPAIDPDHDVADDLLTRLSPGGEILETLSLYDILAASDFPFAVQKAGEQKSVKRRLIDLLHCNAIRPAWIPALAGREPIYGRDAVLVTSRHQDELMIIDLARRRLLWHWGRGILSGPHEGSVLPGGGILVFDNGLARGWSRVLEFDPLAPVALSQFAPGPARFFSRVMGSCQRLPNGNTLIVHSEGGSAFELTPQGRPVWTYEGTLQTPDGHRVKVIRMRRIPPAVIEGILTRLGTPETTPGRPAGRPQG